MNLITIENNEAEIISTNYWQTEHAIRGLLYLSINAGTLRLLLPEQWTADISDMKTAKVVIISRGPWPAQGKSDALELLFEDETDSPYMMHISAEQVDRMPRDTDRDRHGQPPRWKFSAWTQAGKVFELPCRYRLVKYLPWMKAW